MFVLRRITVENLAKMHQYMAKIMQKQHHGKMCTHTHTRTDKQHKNTTCQGPPNSGKSIRTCLYNTVKQTHAHGDTNIHDS